VVKKLGNTKGRFWNSLVKNKNLTAMWGIQMLPYLGIPSFEKGYVSMEREGQNTTQLKIVD